VSIMAINNEIGVTQPLAEIGALCRKRGVFFHTDAAQAAGKVPLDVNALNIDAMSISGHKVGASYVASCSASRSPLRPTPDLRAQGRGRHLPAPAAARAARAYHQRRRAGARAA
jgi:cysteine desulfurase